MPGSVKAEVIAARMMDPGGDPDWKVEKAEARTKVENDNTRICLRAAPAPAAADRHGLLLAVRVGHREARAALFKADAH